MNKRIAFALVYVAFLAAVGTAFGKIVNNGGVVKSNGTPKVTLGITPEDVARISAQAKREQITSRKVVDGWMIEEWRNGDGVRVVSNRVQKVVGAKLKSTFTERIAALETARDDFKAKMESWKSDSERRQQAAQAVIQHFVEQRDNARLATTKAIYQAVIDKLNEKLGNGK